jgi:hypothetical protein
MFDEHGLTTNRLERSSGIIRSLFIAVRTLFGVSLSGVVSHFLVGDLH